MKEKNFLDYIFYISIIIGGIGILLILIEQFQTSPNSNLLFVGAPFVTLGGIGFLFWSYKTLIKCCSDEPVTVPSTPERNSVKLQSLRNSTSIDINPRVSTNLESNNSIDNKEIPVSQKDIVSSTPNPSSLEIENLRDSTSIDINPRVSTNLESNNSIDNKGIPVSQKDLVSPSPNSFSLEIENIRISTSTDIAPKDSANIKTNSIYNNENQLRILTQQSKNLHEEFKKLIELKHFPLIEEVEKKEKIGEGYGGDVFKGIWGSKLVALKQVRSGELDNFINEGERIRDLNHPNIVRLWGIVKDNDNYLLCTEFVLYGSSDKYLKNRFQNNQVLKPIELLRLAVSGVKGMKYLEKKKMIHRDLAARNFLVEIEGSQKIYLKVSDFGLSRTIEKTEQGYYKPNSSKDTVPYQWVALEILKAESGKRRYTHKSDVWSFGVVLWELFNHCQEEPFQYITWDGIVKKLDQGDRLNKGKTIPDDVYEVMLDCWNENPEKRPSFAELYSKLKNVSNSLF